MSLTGRWKGVNVAVKVIEHQGAGHNSNIAVAREKMIGIASAHPNVVLYNTTIAFYFPANNVLKSILVPTGTFLCGR